MNDYESVYDDRLRRGLCVSAGDAYVVCDSDGVRMTAEPEPALAAAAPFMGYGRPLVYRMPGDSDWQWLALTLTAFHGGDVMDLTLLTHADSLLASRAAHRLVGRSCLYLDGADWADWDKALPRLRGLSAGLMAVLPMDDGLAFENASIAPTDLVVYMPCRRPPAALTEDTAHFTDVSGDIPDEPLPTLAVAGAMLWLGR